VIIERTMEWIACIFKYVPFVLAGDGSSISIMPSAASSADHHLRDASKFLKNPAG
jgi:hypothetical protein